MNLHTSGIRAVDDKSITTRLTKAGEGAQPPISYLFILVGHKY